MTTFQVTNPFTGEAGTPYPLAKQDELETILVTAVAAARSDSRHSVAERAAAVTRIAQLHDERAPTLAEIIVQEMGKPLAEAIAEVEFCAAIYRYYAENAAPFLADESLGRPSDRTWIRKSPLGPILGIMPWNFPLYQIARFAAPNLILGNPVLVKPAPQCPASASALQSIFDVSGLPQGAYTTVFANEEQIATLIDDARVRGVSLTGSERAGRAVGSAAGTNLKKVVLELGGSDPFILLSTDDMDAVVDAAVFARVSNAGQVCNGAKRFIVVDALYEQFARLFSTAMSEIAPGDPMIDGTQLGPLASLAAAQTLEAQVTAAVRAGATLRAGTGKSDGTRFSPTVLEDITPDNPARQEEFFGPVAQLYRVSDEDEAIELANATPYGLGSYVFSTDPEQAQRVAEQLDVGMVFINEVGGEAPELPFGGVKNSGTGRELGSRGVEEFMNRKLIKVSG